MLHKSSLWFSLVEFMHSFRALKGHSSVCRFPHWRLQHMHSSVFSAGAEMKNSERMMVSLCIPMPRAHAWVELLPANRYQSEYEGDEMEWL